MEKDKISVIVPVYGVEQYLERCISSICNQTYKNLEIILVDDESPDNCGKICDTWAKQDSRIIVIHQKNGGVSRARNAGLRVASGDYVGFVDSDDYIIPEMYELLYKEMITYDADLVMCAYRAVWDNGDAYPERYKMLPEGVTSLEHLIEVQYENARNHCSCEIVWNKLFPKRIIENVYFPEGKRHEDAAFLNMYMEKVSKIAVVEKELYYYTQRSDGFMRSSFSEKRIVLFYILRERLLMCKKLGYGKGAVSSCAVYTVNTGIRYWTKLHKNKMLPKNEIQIFYDDTVKLIKEYKQYGSFGQKAVWNLFCIWPNCIRILYAMKTDLRR